MKTCRKCKLEKSVSAFGSHRGFLDGLRPTCKACNLKPPRTYQCGKCEGFFTYQASGAAPNLCPTCELTHWKCFACREVLERGAFHNSKESRAGLAYRCKACTKAITSSEAGARVRKAGGIQARYGISLEEYESHVLAADGVCPCCGRSGRKKMCMDHDHETGAIRGIVCSACNSGIGLLGDGIEGLEKALAYLRSVTT